MKSGGLSGLFIAIGQVFNFYKTIIVYLNIVTM